MDAAWRLASEPQRPGSRFAPNLLERISGVDFVLPLGEFCEAWMLLSDMGLRGPTYPFDYLGLCLPSAAHRCLVEFRERHSRGAANLLGPFWPNFDETWNNAFGMQFGFLLQPESTCAEIDAMRVTLVRRVNRLRETLTAVPAGGSVTVLHTCYNERDDQTPLQPLLELLAELRNHWCPQAGAVGAVSLRPREAASKPEVWALPQMLPEGTAEVAVGYVDLPDYGGLPWPDRMIAFRAALCASCGFKAYRSVIAHQDRFPWSTFVDNESELEDSRYNVAPGRKEPRFET
jgi:hypothetical protein